MSGLKHDRDDWYKDLVIYQIYPKSFQDTDGDGLGDLNGIYSRLEYIKELGVNAIWFSPVYESPNYDNGYDISDYRSINPQFGTMEDFDRIVEEAHRLGIAVIMDLVVNHTSFEHRWFLESKKSKEGKYSDYYIWRDPVDGHEPNNWASCFGGSAWEYCAERNQYYLHLFSPQQPDLNYESEDVVREVMDIIDWWLAKGVDGFRVDAISYMDKGDFSDSDNPVGVDGYTLDMDCLSNLKGTHNIIHLMRERFDRYNACSVGEVNILKDNDYLDYVSDDRKEFNMVIPFKVPIVEVNTWSPLKMKKEIINNYKLLKDKGWWAMFLSNHDKPRQVSLYGNDKDYRYESAKMLAALMQTLPGTPFVFQGEEIGMTDVRYASMDAYNDLDMKNIYHSELLAGKSEAEAFEIAASVSRDNARTPMQWDGSVNGGFSTGNPWLGVNPNYREINVENEKAKADSIFNFYKELISMRLSEECLRRGELEFSNVEDPHIFAYERKLEDKRFKIVANFSSESETYELTDRGAWSIRMTNYSRTELADTLSLKPYEVVIMEN